MKTPLYKEYANAHPIGVYTMCNTFALVILALDSNTCVAAFTNPSGAPGYDHVRRHAVHYSPSGRAYIRKGGMRFYFDQISRI